MTMNIFMLEVETELWFPWLPVATDANPRNQQNSEDLQQDEADEARPNKNIWVILQLETGDSDTDKENVQHHPVFEVLNQP